tara:strand:- start:8527 stop:9216 length:690 start_codon:yes stop_codon:yes gene_type:complete
MMTEHSYKHKIDKLKQFLKNAPQVRNFNKGRFGVHIVHFPSLKNERTVTCESTIEADFALRLEHDQNVLGYRCQPETFSFYINDCAYSYTPDFLVYFDDFKEVYYEVKPNDWDLDTQLAERLPEITELLHKQGKTFEVITESEIRPEPFISNLNQLYPRIHNIDEASIVHIRSCLKKLGGKTDIKSLRSLDPRPSEDAIMYALFFGPKLHIDKFRLTPKNSVELIEWPI